MGLNRKRLPWAAGIAAVLAVAVALGGAYVVRTTSRAPEQGAEALYAPWLNGRSQPSAAIPSVESIIGGESEGESTEPPALPARLRIPVLGVDAPVVTLGITPAGNLDSPDEPEAIGWYDLTPRPGGEGNAVFSGHRDWAGYGPAVLWTLGDIRSGDEIHVDLADGTEYSYVVTTVQSYLTEDVPMELILAEHDQSIITIITCIGELSAGDYSHRLVVEATAR